MSSNKRDELDVLFDRAHGGQATPEDEQRIAELRRDPAIDERWRGYELVARMAGGRTGPSDLEPGPGVEAALMARIDEFERNKVAKPKSSRLWLLFVVPVVVIIIIAAWAGKARHPAQPIPTPTPDPALVRFILGEVVNLDDRPWKVTSDCKGPSAKTDGGTLTPKGTVNSSKKLGLGYGANGQFTCATALEGGSSTCVLHGGDRCSIRNGVLSNDGSN